MVSGVFFWSATGLYQGFLKALVVLAKLLQPLQLQDWSSPAGNLAEGASARMVSSPAPPSQDASMYTVPDGSPGVLFVSTVPQEFIFLRSLFPLAPV